MKNVGHADGTDARFSGRLLSPLALALFGVIILAPMVSLLSGYGLPQIALVAKGRMALLSFAMMLGFCGLVGTALLSLSDGQRNFLTVLFGAAFLGSGFVALVGWFAVSGASGYWF
jgi:hypothetical protein